MNDLDNPFSVETPELMSAKEIVDLFVPVEGAYNLEVSGHLFLHGHRGSGKSMMFRRLEPDCQQLINSKTAAELDFFGVYSSIKKTDIDIVDFSIIENPNARSVLSEHVLVCFFLSKIFSAISDHCELSETNLCDQFKSFINNQFSVMLANSGFIGDLSNRFSDLTSEKKLVLAIMDLFDEIYASYIRYLKRVLLGLGEHINYSGPLLGFFDFLLPVTKKLKSFKFLPDGPFYLLIDDADNLNIEQTKVLNTWVSYRTTDVVSLKIATQLNYKTMQTTSGRRIETPHDYSEINYSNVYTGSKKEKYPDWVREVTKRRLKSFYFKQYDFDEPLDPDSYFPADGDQEEKIRKIAEEYLSGERSGGGFRKSDDAYRYARPDYIMSLGGSKKSSSTYKYAGFSQLVHISSGVIRHFLEPASKMFALQARDAGGKCFTKINPSSQNKIIREEADKLLFTHMDKLEKDLVEGDIKKNQVQKLRSLVTSLGSLFYHAMDSERSERRVFSFAISDLENLSDELKQVLNLGVQEGIFYESYIGLKEGMGRTRLYVLTRRLAPMFKLDPIGFSAYKFVTCSFLEISMSKPKSIINKLKKHGIESFDEPKNEQESLFEV